MYRNNHSDTAGVNQKKGALVSLTRTGAGWVLSEVLSREQERDLQGSEGQEAALVGKIQEVKTCEGSGTVFVFTELVYYVHAEKHKQRVRQKRPIAAKTGYDPALMSWKIV